MNYFAKHNPTISLADIPFTSAALETVPALDPRYDKRGRSQMSVPIVRRRSARLGRSYAGVGLVPEEDDGVGGVVFVAENAQCWRWRCRSVWRTGREVEPAGGDHADNVAVGEGGDVALDRLDGLRKCIARAAACVGGFAVGRRRERGSSWGSRWLDFGGGEATFVVAVVPFDEVRDEFGAVARPASSQVRTGAARGLVKIWGEGVVFQSVGELAGGGSPSVLSGMVAGVAVGVWSVGVAVARRKRRGRGMGGL